MLMTPPETLNSIFWPLLRPACRRTDGGTTSGVLFLTVTGSAGITLKIWFSFQCRAAGTGSLIAGTAKQTLGAGCDLYQFYSGSDASFRNDELWKMLDQQRRPGKIRHLGISILGKGSVTQATEARSVGPLPGVSGTPLKWGRILSGFVVTGARPGGEPRGPQPGGWRGGTGIAFPGRGVFHAGCREPEPCGGCIA